MDRFTELVQENNTLRVQQNILFKHYYNLRKSLERLGPVAPIKKILDAHYGDMQSCGHEDPLRENYNAHPTRSRP